MNYLELFPGREHMAGNIDEIISLDVWAKIHKGSDADELADSMVESVMQKKENVQLLLERFFELREQNIKLLEENSTISTKNHCKAIKEFFQLQQASII